MWHDWFPDSIKSNADFANLVAEHCSDFFSELSPALLRDKAIVLRAIQVNPHVYLELMEKTDLTQDYDVAVAMVTHADGLGVLLGVMWCDGYCYRDQWKFLRTMKIEATAQIQAYLYKGFTEGYLRGFLQSCPGSKCRLSMIDNDPEFSIALRKSIADYVGVPHSRQISQLQKLVENVSRWVPE